MRTGAREHHKESAGREQIHADEHKDAYDALSHDTSPSRAAALPLAFTRRIPECGKPSAASSPQRGLSPQCSALARSPILRLYPVCRIRAELVPEAVEVRADYPMDTTIFFARGICNAFCLING